MPGPATSTAIINDLIPGVQAALQNRSDASENQTNPAMRPSFWIRAAIREITESQPFEELRVIGPTVTIGPGLGFQGSSYIFPISMFLASGDDYTMTEDPVIFLGNTSGLNLGQNTVGYPMTYMTPKAIAPLVSIPGGVPFKYTRYGGNFWFGTQPGQNYQVYVPYQRKHPFNGDNLTTSPVFMPSSWFDVIEYAAAERGAVVNRWNDQSEFLHKLLYGDPASQLKDGTLARPGLIAARTLQAERDKRLSTVAMMPAVQRY